MLKSICDRPYQLASAKVVVHFEGDAQSHALNAFETTDRGLVWIDCSSSSFELSSAFSSAAGSDKAAYVAVGEEYNLVGLAVAADVDYAYHLEWLKEDLNRSSCSGL